MNDLTKKNEYPENDYRSFLEHSLKGSQRKNHKYIARKPGKNGRWIYIYDKLGATAKRDMQEKLKISDRENARAKYLSEYSNRVNSGNYFDKDNPNFARDAFIESKAQREKANKAGSEYHAALNKYKKTPIGRYETAKDYAVSVKKKLRGALSKYLK